MPRNLPWLKKANTAPPERRSGNTNIRVKRQRLLDPSSDIEFESGNGSRKQKPPSTRISPPPHLEPPLESSMDEGLDKDDQYRMVEDELLEIAKQFTQHLHAAEYQRLKRIARSQKAETINSISRPVTIRIPDETHRKLESVSRSKRQANVVQSLLDSHAKDSGSKDDFDEKRGAWVGTTLHGLMESPKMSSASLTNVVEIVTSTRAAAGFKNRRSRKLSTESPPPSRTGSNESLTASEDDGDLDLPTPIEKSGTSHLTMGTTSRIIGNSLPPSSNSARERIARRMEHGKLQKSKQQDGGQKQLEIIPTFLS